MTTTEIKFNKALQFGHFNNIIYNPEWLLSDRINKLIDKGKVKYYQDWYA